MVRVDALKRLFIKIIHRIIVSVTQVNNSKVICCCLIQGMPSKQAFMIDTDTTSDKYGRKEHIANMPDDQYHFKHQTVPKYCRNGAIKRQTNLALFQIKLMN